MPHESGLIPLEDFAQQTFLVGNPPVLTFTHDGRRVDRELLALSVQLRQAMATERLAAALEGQTRLLAASRPEPGFTADQWSDGLNHLQAVQVKGDRLVHIDVLATSPEMGSRFIQNIGEVLKAAAVAAEQQEGGQAS